MSFLRRIYRFILQSFIHILHIYTAEKAAGYQLSLKVEVVSMRTI